MRKSGLWPLCAIGLLFLAAPPAQSQETIREPSTKVEFPAQITITQGDTSYTLVATGTAVRKKLIFKGYAVVHYMEDPPQGDKEQVLTAVLHDGKAKRLVLHFVRDVDAETIQNAWREGFEKNTDPEVLLGIQPLVDQFVGYFTEKVLKGETYVFTWLPGGIVLTTVKGEEKPAIGSVEFARGLWSIWLGKKPVVNRDKLIERLVQKS